MENIEENIVGKQFDAYVKVCIKRLSLNYNRNELKKWNNDVKFLAGDELEEYIYENTNGRYNAANMDSDLNDEKYYEIFGEMICVKSKLIIDMLDWLSDHYRSIILLYYYSNFNDREIALLFGLSTKTLNNHRRTALKQLKDYLELHNE